jgi:16S rRNA (guanine527-N7)-methyltransferase
VKTTPLFYNSEDIIEKYNIAEPLNRFLEYLIEYNQKINLVSRETGPEDIKRIAADCLIPFEYSSPPKNNFLDIGVGSGFPSIVICLAFPDTKAVMIERTLKKADYLRSASDFLGIDSKIISKDFIEASSKFKSEIFDTIFIKLVRPDEKMFRKIISLLKPQGRFIYYASRDNLELPIPDSVIPEAYNYYLDNPQQLRSVTVFSKK